MITRGQKILFLLLHAAFVGAVVSPVFQTTGYVQSNSGRIIDGDACACTIGNGTAPIVLMSYVGSFPAVPYYTYGVSRYEGSDYLGSEIYEVTKTSVTNRDITFKARVLGISRIWVLEVRYFLVSKSFPYLVNSFDNVPVNLSSGAITNISTYSLTTKTYTNTISFSSQAVGSGSSYTSFTLPLTDHKIILFPTTLYLAGTEQPAGATTFNPIKLSITGTPVSTSSYKIQVKLGINATITKLHFSILMYNYVNIYNSRIYKMNYEKNCYPITGGNYVYPPQFQNSIMGALAEFQTTRTTSVIHFQLDVLSSGAYMPPSSPRDASMTTLSQFCYHVLYLKHWFCPGGRTFDPWTEMCTECPTVLGCLTCLTSTYCSVCYQSLGYFPTGTGTCQLCSVTGCTTCTTDANTCSICDATLNYVLTTPTCLLCDSTANMFANTTSQTCQSCAVADCLNCSTLTTCAICDIANLYYVGPDQTCLLCDPTLNYFFDPVTTDCNLCTISQCLNCTNLTACTQCNTTNDYTVNPTTGQCQICTIVGCLNCSDIYTCVQCDLAGNYIMTGTNTCLKCTTGLFANATSAACEPCSVAECLQCSTLTTCQTCNYTGAFYVAPDFTCAYCDPSANDFINMTTLDCQACSLDHCTTCASLTQCTTCDTGADYFLNTTSGLCQACGVILAGCLDCNDFSTCIVCDPTGFVPTGSTCTPICGDGLVRSYQQCDDSNLVAGDGCSATCTIEIGYVCSSQPSTCDIDHNAQKNTLASIQRVGCNSFKAITVKPAYPYNTFPQTITSMTDGVIIASIAENYTHFTIICDYNKDITGVPIVFGFTPGIPLVVEYNPTMPALYYTAKECDTVEQTSNLFLAIEVTSYAILIVSILSCKIVGLELFGVLQLSYFTLSSHSFLNIYLQPLSQFRTFNGLNLQFTSEAATLPSNLQSMQVNASFINNFNIMLLLLIVEFLVGLVMYVVAIKTNREKLRQIALRLMKQGFITLVLFNIFNIAFSAGVHWKYASPSDPGYAGSSFVLYGTLLAMVAAVIAMELTGKDEYGEFKKKFKRVWICEFYIPLTILYRMALGFYIGYQSDYQQSTLLILSFSIAFMMYTMINLPFRNVYQNYRCSLVHLTMLYTLLTTNYYRSMKSTTEMSVKGKIYTPAIIELVLIVACICVSLFVLAYEIYYMVRQWWERRKIDGGSEKSQQANPINQPPQMNQTEQNIAPETNAQDELVASIN